jgi:DNA-directed RNA polymerase subunit E'
MGKIGITCRQPFLGAVEWIADEIKKAKAGTAVEKEKQSRSGQQQQQLQASKERKPGGEKK